MWRRGLVCLVQAVYKDKRLLPVASQRQNVNPRWGITPVFLTKSAETIENTNDSKLKSAKSAQPIEFR